MMSGLEQFLDPVAGKDGAMVVNHYRRFVFYHVPKAAGSSIRAALISVPGSEAPKKGTKHVLPDQYPLDSSYFSFCFVRDPLERFGSLHRYLTLRPKKFPLAPSDVNAFALELENRTPWVMTLHSIRPQSDYARRMSFVGRYERLSDDFGSISKSIGVRLSLDHINASGEEIRYRCQMTARTRDIISDFYREDLERFHY